MLRKLAMVGMLMAAWLTAPSLVQDASAQSAFAPSAQDKPLVIIRFNQPRVDYARSLRRAVDEALRTNRSMNFHVMAFVPTAANGMATAVDQQQSGKFVDMVTYDMMRMGVDQYAMTTSQQVSPLVGSHELHIFVY